MATTTGTVVFYPAWIATMLNGADLSADTFNIGLLDSTYTYAASDAVDGDLSGKVTTNLDTAVLELADVTCTQTAGVATFDFTDPEFLASGGSFTARYFYIIDTSISDALVCYGLLDQADQDVTTTNGNTLTLNIDPNGLFTVQVV